MEDILSQIIPWAIVLISGALTVKFWAKAHKILTYAKELGDVANAIIAAKNSNSPGGVEVTKDEGAKIYSEVIEFLVSVGILKKGK